MLAKNGYYRGVRGDLNIDRRPWFDIDYLLNTSLEVHRLRVIELAIIYPNFVILISYNTKAKPSIESVSTSAFNTDQVAIQEYLIATHSLGHNSDRGISISW